MRHRHHGAAVVGQEPLEPGDRLGVQVIRRFVQEQQIGRLQQQPAQRDPSPLAAGERRDVGRSGREPQRVHRHLHARIEVPRAGGVNHRLEFSLLLERVLHFERAGSDHREVDVDPVVTPEQRVRVRHPLVDVARDILRRIELRLLRQVPDRQPGGRECLAVELRNLAGHDSEQGALAGAVGPQDADLRPRQERQPDVLEHGAVGGVPLAEPLHCVDVLWRHRGGLYAGATGAPDSCAGLRSGNALGAPASTPAPPAIRVRARSPPPRFRRPSPGSRASSRPRAHARR